ncbi:MAG: DNA cytosine methyltransferase [Hyalangium sp.]|uniref:DNA cytosine methyltransferase n=1 Tax=Hyalangium sp. TaxID=2028555 RepID=UPI00389A88CF
MTMHARNRKGLVVDLFAGGGGASTGIEAALGRPVDIAINHNPTALAVHAENHPSTRHLTADIWEVRPQEATGGRPVDVLWASPDCTHFSIAKGGTPREKNIRSLAWVVVEWAQAVRPRCIFLENVAEFRTWGPLGPDGQPDKARMGETFAQWRARLEFLGYQVEYRVLDASHYGARTRRKRLFLVGRCDGEPIRWPEPTHGPGKLPLRTAECIDWDLPCPSIFERKKPLAEKTLWRIAQGIRRFVLENPEPFIIGCGGRAGQTPPTPLSAPVGTITAKNDRSLVVPHILKVNHGGRTDRAEPAQDPLSTVTAQRRGHALVAAFLSKHYGGHMTPGASLASPMDTITATDHHALSAATLVKLNGECHGAALDEPMPTVKASGNHIAAVHAFLMQYYGSGGQWAGVNEPMRTITAKHRVGLVAVHGVDYQIVDIGMRMLEPHELLRAQFGRFASNYDMSAATSKAAQVRLIGNSVCPEAAEAVVRANLRGDKHTRVAA